MAYSRNKKEQAGGKYTDLKRRLLFLAFALIVYRIGAHIPVPGIDPDMLQQLFNQQQGGILGLFNMCALSLLAVCAWHHAVHFCSDYPADAVLRDALA